MLTWIKQWKKRNIFILCWAIMMVITLSVLFYSDYKLNHITIDEHIYTVGNIQENSWHLVSETGKDIIISNGLNREILWPVDDLTMSIGDDEYTIRKSFNQNFAYNYFIDVNGKEIAVNQIASLIENKQHPILIPLIIYHVIFTTIVCIHLVYPMISWKLKMLFVTKGGEPTDYYLSTTRLVALLIWLFIIIKTVTTF